MTTRRLPPIRGRGAGFNPGVRFESAALEPFDDGWGSIDALADDRRPRTEVLPDTSRTIIARNQSPDIPFEQSINAYRGCEHGCIYCYARPSHAFLGLSPGLDFETKLFAKHDAVALLERELSRKGYRCRTIALGANTDPYQPLERRLELTRGILELLARCRHPVGIVTKSAAVTRDLDLLSRLAADGLVRVALSITTLEPDLARTMEPRAPTPARRLDALKQLRAARIPAGVMVAPIIPGLTDHEIERILDAAADTGAVGASFTLLRLPYELKELFEDWLQAHAPERAGRVLSLIRQCRDGRLNDPRFGQRMRGQGPYAQAIARRFALACRRLGLDQPQPALRTDLFVPPGAEAQLRLV